MTGAATPTPLVSVVVIGRNEGSRLVRCIESIRAIAPLPGPVEVVYVDSASTDGSPERARALGARVLEVKPERPCAAVGRNAGWKAARGRYVLFLDGDTVLHPLFVATALGAFEGRDPAATDERTEGKVAVVWGHRREIDVAGSFYNRVLDLDWVYPPGPSEFCGGDALMRRDVLEEVGGYDDTLIAGEEPEMCRRMRAKGWVILHVDAPMTGHDLAMRTFAAYWRRAFRAGFAYAEVSHRFRGTGSPLWEEDARRNLLRAPVLLALPLAGLVGTVLLGSPWPALLALGLLLLLAARSAWKARWKGGAAATLFLYGVHSHFQQVPILAGQLAWYRDRRAGRRRALIEYKGVP